MRFIDEARIKVAAGRGGPGCVSFRREKNIPKGGPDGGDGGKGGDVWLESASGLSTLQDFRYKRVYDAGHGDHGKGSNKAGKDGEELIIRVPVGTIVKDADSGDVLIDMSTHGERWPICKGGRGGKGNAHFASSTHQAPKFAQPGEEGEFKEILLELKLLADVGILGFPNAGKSTLISRVSAAKPKIADYAFTTLVPNLGVVALPEYRSFVIADIPGLIEGAHAGRGLGHRFLKHIERTRLFVHMVDGAQILELATKPDFQADDYSRLDEELDRLYGTIRTELGLYDEALLEKPELLAFNKIDLIMSEPALLEAVRRGLRKTIAKHRKAPLDPREPFLLSTITGEGIPGLLHWLEERLFPPPEPITEIPIR